MFVNNLILGGSLLKMKYPLILNYNKEILCYIR